MSPLADALKAMGFETYSLDLQNSRASKNLNVDHLQQIEESLQAAGKCVCVAHSGAGVLLSGIDTNFVHAYVFLDAILSLSEGSRFDTFEDSKSILEWKNSAIENGKLIPASKIATIGKQIENVNMRAQFERSLRDVPIRLYEDRIPYNHSWPSNVPGLYLQWTTAYCADADRAKCLGFKVVQDQSDHLKLMNKPKLVASEIVEFVSNLG